MSIAPETGVTASRGVSARRLTFLAMLSAAIGIVLLIIAAQGGGDGDGGGSDWIVGLLVIAAPLLCAAAVRSVAASTLLRPVGSIVTAVCALAAAVHVGLAIDERGTAGWVYGAGSVATTVLLLAAVVRGRDERSGPPGAEWVAQGMVAAPELDFQGVDGPPLDVVTPLRDARNHAAKSALAWLAVLGIAAVVTVPLLRLLGWPEVSERVTAQVVDVRDIGARTAVTFEAQTTRGIARWTYEWESNTADVGERREAFLDEDGYAHFDQQFGLSGMPLFWPLALVVMFSAFAIRRVWGIAIAWWDVHRVQDPPRLGYAAVIDDPAPKTWRPLLAVWRENPTTGSRLEKPDAVYRADDETGEHLQSTSTRVIVRRAWVDTGMWQTSKPRWVGFEDGVAVPHRRAMLGRWYVHVITRKADAENGPPLRHGPPEPRLHAPVAPHQPSRHRIGGMIAWRLLALVLGIGIAFFYVRSGAPAQFTEELSMLTGSAAY